MVQSRPPDPAPAAAAAVRIDLQAYREVMGRFATGVTVVTTALDGPHGYQPWGTTVNAFTSVSLEPPLVLVCVGQERSIHPIIERVGHFAVNILAEESQGLSDCFAGAPSELPRSAFCGAAYARGPAGMPILAAGVAHLECSVERTVPAGDHTIFLGRVVDLGLSEIHPLPLLYYRGRYLRIERAATSELLGKPDDRYPPG
jgi:flavin reductase (DIM6/NTAB) family NADH-FMN oxidoreductase RutF